MCFRGLASFVGWTEAGDPSGMGRLSGMFGSHSFHQDDVRVCHRRRPARLGRKSQARCGKLTNTRS